MIEVEQGGDENIVSCGLAPRLKMIGNMHILFGGGYAIGFVIIRIVHGGT